MISNLGKLKSQQNTNRLDEIYDGCPIQKFVTINLRALFIGFWILQNKIKDTKYLNQVECFHVYLWKFKESLSTQL